MIGVMALWILTGVAFASGISLVLTEDTKPLTGTKRKLYGIIWIIVGLIAIFNLLGWIN